MRKTLTYTVQSDNRDNGKCFLIREMPATKAEKWAIRAFLALGKSGIELPEGWEQTGMAGMARIGLGMVAKLPYDQAEPLLDEMMECVSIIPNPNKPEIVRSLVEDDIEEVSTRLKLRAEVFNLHVGFSQAAGK